VHASVVCMQANSSGGSGISGEQLIDRVVTEMMGQGWLLCFDEFQVRTCNLIKRDMPLQCLNYIVIIRLVCVLKGCVSTLTV
jgi:hypothetical protein